MLDASQVGQNLMGLQQNDRHKDTQSLCGMKPREEDEEDSNAESEEEQFTDIDEEGEEAASEEEEYMEKAETLMRILERLEELKLEGE